MAAEGGEFRDDGDGDDGDDDDDDAVVACHIMLLLSLLL